MKKYLLLTSVLCSLLTGCSYYSTYSTFYYTDFQKYAKSGFTVSNLSDFSGRSYVAIGNLVLKTNKKLNYQELLDQMVNKAKKIGANGLVGYNVEIYETKYSRYRVASGVAVVFDKPLPVVREKIRKNVRYDIAKALEDVKYKRIYLVVKNGTVVEQVYDPDTKKYLTFQQFIDKYGEETLFEIYKSLENEESNIFQNLLRIEEGVKNPNHL